MGQTTVDIILPVYWGNLSEVEPSVKKQVIFLREHLKEYQWRIVLSVNGKNEIGILKKAKELSKKFPEVTYVYTEEAGKGIGVFYGWQQSKAKVRMYMDIDLATDLHCIPRLIRPIEEGFDLCVGNRYDPLSDTQREFDRFLISKTYILLFYKGFLGARCNDPQCGFKAVNERVVRELIPRVKDRRFFFESELLYWASKKGYKLKEIPVRWRPTPFSSVNMKKIIPDFIKNVLRLKKAEWAHHE